MAEKALNLQHQVRENAQELGDFLSDLSKWEGEIKQKDDELKKEAKIEEIVPPVRRGGKKNKDKVSSRKKEVQFKDKQVETEIKKSRISSYDYDAWSKFDVDSACKNVDDEANEAEDYKDESGDEESGDEESGDADEEEDEGDLEAELEAEQRRRRQKSEFEKEKGNFLFKEGKYEAAINRYTTAADLDPYNSIIFANRAMALIKLERFAAAEADCSKALSLDPEYAKAVARRATARTKLKRYNEAKEDQEYLLKLQPNNRQAKLEIERLEKELAKLEKSSQTQASSRRSRKPLKRIVIEEIGSEEEDDTTKPKRVEEVTAKEHQIREYNVKGAMDIKEDTSKNSQLETKHAAHASKTEDPVKRELAIPKSPVQFETEFKKLKKNPEEFNNYFRIIPPTLYRSLFHHSMDEILPRALDCINEHYFKENKEYWEELKELAEVPRFEMALMFLSKNSKKVVAELFKNILETAESRKMEKEKIITLAKRYGLSL